MRICGKCKERECRNITSSYCKVCHNEYQKDFYKKKPRNTIDATIKRRLVAREMVVSAKNKPCGDCGIKYPYYVMDLDHRRGEKLFNLSTVSSKYRSILAIQLEIDKCDVVCSNCHRERTFNTKN